MAVSREKTHWYFSGDANKCREAMPFCLHMAHLNDVVMAYGEVGVWTRHFTIPGGGKGIVHTFNGTRSIYIDMPPSTGTYADVVEEYSDLEFLYDPVVCFNPATGREIECNYENKCYGPGKSAARCLVERLFKRRAVTKKSGYENEVFYTTDIQGKKTYPNRSKDAKKAIQKICPANDASWHHCYHSWSKTVDNYTATCFLFYDQWLGVNMWAISLDKDGEHLPFQAGKLTYDWWPYPGVVDVVQVGGVDPDNVTPVYKAFDLWKEIKTEHGKEVTKYYLSVLADPSQHIDVWCLNYSDKTMWLETISIAWIGNFIEDNHLHFPYTDDGWETRHIRVIGLVKRTGYWAMIDCDYGAPTGGYDQHRVYWENDKESGSVWVEGQNECGFQFAILDEYDESIVCVPAIYCLDEPEYQKPAKYSTMVDCYQTVFNTNNGETVWTGPCTGNSCGECTYMGHVLKSPCVDIPEAYPESYTKSATSTWKCEDFNSWYIQTQLGLESGYYTMADAWQAWFNSGVSGGGCGWDNSYYGGEKFIWENWMYQRPVVLSAHVIPDQVGMLYRGFYKDGYLEGKYVLDKWITYNDTTVLTTRDTEFEYNEDFGQGQWPYYPSYAIVKNAYACKERIVKDTTIKTDYLDREKTRTIEIYKNKEKDCHIVTGNKFAVRGNDGKLYSESNGVIGSGTFFFYEARKRQRRFVYDVD